MLIVVGLVAHRPSVTNATTHENVETNSGLVITRSPIDGPAADFYKISGITGGTLFQHDGITRINEGNFITAAQGAAGLKFMPSTNSVASGTFNVEASTSNADAGLGGGVVTATITVNPTPSLKVPTAQAALEDAPSVFSSAGANPILVRDPQGPGVARLTLTAAGGTLTLASTAGVTLVAGTGSNDSTTILQGTLEAINAALDGLNFIPAAHLTGPAQISVVADDGTGTASASIGIAVAPVAHTPSAADAATVENIQTAAAIVIVPSSLDRTLSGFFKITGISGGTLFQNDGLTPVADGRFITFLQGQAGLRFTPAPDSVAPGAVSGPVFHRSL